MCICQSESVSRAAFQALNVSNYLFFFVMRCGSVAYGWHVRQMRCGCLCIYKQYRDSKHELKNSLASQYAQIDGHIRPLNAIAVRQFQPETKIKDVHSLSSALFRFLAIRLLRFFSSLFTLRFARTNDNSGSGSGFYF